MSESTEELAELVAERLRSDAELIVQDWIDWVRARIGTSTISALPERAIRNHIPPVLKALADYVCNPIHAMREQMLGHLRIHGQIRRDQGYAVHEVLSEFDGLAFMVTAYARERFGELESEFGTPEVLEVSSRLATGLRAVSFACVGAYHESEERLRQSLFTQLEEFARVIAHELRNPLNTAHIVATTLQDDGVVGDDTKRNELIGSLSASIDRATQFLENIRVLAFTSAAQAGESLIELEAAVIAARTELAEAASSAGVEVRVSTLPSVRAESVLVHVVLVNLLGNAIKYHDSEKDERYVEVSAQLIPEEHDSGFCELVVEDNGVGIPEELLPRVMQSGFRASPDVAEGTGLGLYIVQRMLHDRGGDIRVESESGSGTRVLCRFRCLDPAPDGGGRGLDLFNLIETSVEDSLRINQEDEAEG